MKQSVGFWWAVSCACVLVTTGRSAADQVFNDDLITIGSLSVGQDSVNGENFGFDTIRLKENNLRLHFQDTSTSASFPSNDWRIIINDSANGGSNYFGIEDSTAGRIPFRVEAKAPAHSLFVEETGDIGVGTDNPVMRIHAAKGDSPAMRLEQNGSSGFTPQTWDVAGNETNFFIRDVTNGSTLPFKIRPGAPNNALFIQNNGRVGLGTQSPSHTLHVVGNAFITETLEIGSSRTRKEQIRDLTLEEAMQALGDLEPVQFHYKQDPAAQLGFIAEDVPEIVSTANRRSVRPMDFVAVLTKVVQEHERRDQERAAREEELLKSLDVQQKLIEDLATRLENMEAATGLPEGNAVR